MKSIILLILLLANISFCQSNLKLPKYGIPFSCVCWEKVYDEDVYYRYGEYYFPLNFMVGRRSGVLMLNPNHHFEVCTRALNEEGMYEYTVVDKCKIPQGASSLLFNFEVVINGEQEKEVFVKSFEDGLASFTAGDFKFVNMVNSRLKVEFGSDSAVVAPGGDKTINSSLSSSTGFVPLYISGADKNLKLNASLYASKSSRELVFISPPRRKSERLRLRYISQPIKEASQQLMKARSGS